MASIVLNYRVDPISEEAKIAAYYANSVATLVSPHNIRERMSHGVEDYVLVDGRTQEDYRREHIVGAINIDTEWDTYRVEDFVISGSEPGDIPDAAKSLAPCPIVGSLSC